MTRKERLESIIRGAAADRPGVNFYEIGGFDIDTGDPDPFNVYHSESWKRLIGFAEAETDLIRLRSPVITGRNPGFDETVSVEKTIDNGSRYTRTTYLAGKKKLTSLTRRDPDLDTSWVLEHLLKDLDDLDTYLSLPDEIFERAWSVENMIETERALNDRGIVMVDTADPICSAAGLFSMENFTIIALTEPKRFHALLEKVSRAIYAQTEYAAREFPGHLWRIYGPEYATEPYLPPEMFREYVNRYTGPMVDTIHRYGGFARIHCHGRLSAVLPAIVDMGADAIDPIEPPGQGDVELAYVADKYGDRLSLFGNIEVSDIETLDTPAFARKVSQSLEAGRKARGFVLMPTASPYGREISELTMRNYEVMVKAVTS